MRRPETQGGARCAVQHAWPAAYRRHDDGHAVAARLRRHRTRWMRPQRGLCCTHTLVRRWSQQLRTKPKRTNACLYVQHQCERGWCGRAAYPRRRAGARGCGQRQARDDRDGSQGGAREGETGAPNDGVQRCKGPPRSSPTQFTCDIRRSMNWLQRSTESPAHQRAKRGDRSARSEGAMLQR